MIIFSFRVRKFKESLISVGINYKRRLKMKKIPTLKFR